MSLSRFECMVALIALVISSACTSDAKGFCQKLADATSCLSTIDVEKCTSNLTSLCTDDDLVKLTALIDCYEKTDLCGASKTADAAEIESEMKAQQNCLTELMSAGLSEKCMWSN
jgi:hypothetical protein